MTFFRKLKKLVRKVAPVAALALGPAGVGAGLLAKGATAAKAVKGVGMALQKARQLKQSGRKLRGAVVPLVTKADAALAERVGQLTPPGLMKTFSARTAMPGGVPMGRAALARVSGVRRQLRGERRQRAAEARTAARAGRGGPKPAKPARGGRRPPTGGLDLKGLSASWKAAGRPGTWQSWIAANK